MQYHIKEREWEVIFDKLQTIKGIHVRQESLLRKFIEGVWYISRSGCQWSLLPRFCEGNLYQNWIPAFTSMT
jgi:transposase